MTSVGDHILPSFLATEKAMIFGHIGNDIPNRDEVIKLFKSQTSGDKLLQSAVFPILIAYESESVASFTEVCDDYAVDLRGEVKRLRDYFGTCAGALKLRFQLIFVPLGSKTQLVESFDKRLEAFL